VTRAESEKRKLEALLRLSYTTDEPSRTCVAEVCFGCSPTSQTSLVLIGSSWFPGSSQTCYVKTLL